MDIIDVSLSWAYNPGDRDATTHLILHHAAGNGDMASIHKSHLAKGWAGIAYHYYVRKDGSVYRGRPEAWRGGHTEGFNYCSIGICFEGNFENESMGKSQLNAGALLAADIVSRHPGIRLGAHRDYNPTACPGKNFPMTELIKAAGGEDDPEPAPWAGEACRWCVENGIIKGDENGEFHWRANVTRQELCVILTRLARDDKGR